MTYRPLNLPNVMNHPVRFAKRAEIIMKQIARDKQAAKENAAASILQRAWVRHTEWEKMRIRFCLRKKVRKWNIAACCSDRNGGLFIFWPVKLNKANGPLRPFSSLLIQRAFYVSKPEVFGISIRVSDDRVSSRAIFLVFRGRPVLKTSTVFWGISIGWILAKYSPNSCFLDCRLCCRRGCDALPLLCSGVDCECFHSLSGRRWCGGENNKRTCFNHCNSKVNLYPSVPDYSSFPKLWLLGKISRQLVLCVNPSVGLLWLVQGHPESAWCDDEPFHYTLARTQHWSVYSYSRINVSRCHQLIYVNLSTITASWLVPGM